MLLEEGFELVSVDLSCEMLKHALKCRWNRRNETSFNNWIIEEANFLTLIDDLEGKDVHIPEGGFDALICIGNSFPHLLDTKGDQSEQLRALENFYQLLKPGGILIIDHRNFDHILETGKASTNCSLMIEMKTTNVFVDGKPVKTTIDYTFDKTKMLTKRMMDSMQNLSLEEQENLKIQKFRVYFYPHKLKDFTELLKKAFKYNCRHVVYGDFRELSDGPASPYFYCHVIEKLD